MAEMKTRPSRRSCTTLSSPTRLEDIRSHFGDRVASIVRDCSDTDQIPKEPWKERKTRYIAHIGQASPEARRVSCADKVHNARSILRDYRKHREQLWGRFNASGEDQLWYYRRLVEAFREPDATRLAGELERVVSELEAERKRRVAGVPDAGA
jgi:(p)ppGpp synthase/HD superfamily hydrolase